MLKASALAIGLVAVLGTSAIAQTVDIGPNGPSLDLRSQRQRERDYDREQARREREEDRRAARRAYDRESAGGTRCRTTTVRERDDEGRMVTRETRTCR